MLNTELAHHIEFSAQRGLLASRLVSMFFCFKSSSTCVASVVIVSAETVLTYSSGGEQNCEFVL